MSRKNIYPPRLADRFLQWFCSDEVLETLQGDLYELYEKRRERRGKLLADIYYAFDVLSALRPFSHLFQKLLKVQGFLFHQPDRAIYRLAVSDPDLSVGA
jgi:hypothetical protein